MALRVTHGLMYNAFVGNMNRNLSALMESNIQSSSQKRVNRPSDDPVATGRILSSRAALRNIDMYTANVREAMGWLNLADGILGSGDGSVQSILSRIKVLAEEGADGSKSAENRLQISYEIREQFEQILTLANTQFGDNHIFAGHKTDQPAYTQGLGVTVKDTGPDLKDASFHVYGDGPILERTLMIRAASTGPAASASYEYSEDGGTTWKSATVDATQPPPNGCTIIAGGTRVGINNGAAQVTQADPDLNTANNGTWIYVRPTAIYHGDDHDTQVMATYTPRGVTAIPGEASGSFPRDVAVRVDEVDANQISYSYSLDDGSNWTQITAPAGAKELPVPGGYLNLDRAPVAGDAGMQFIIHPHRADIKFQIGDQDYITANIVGKDIFGGQYDPPTDTGLGFDYDGDGEPDAGNIDNQYVVAGEAESNLFEVLGNLIRAAECNDQDGMQEALPLLDNVMNVVLTRAAEVGGRENRLISTQGALTIREFSEEDSLSAHEDVDVTELLTRMAQQQLAYNSVLKSSSMIMQMSLVNFL